jgi:hypothetical protein
MIWELLWLISQLGFQQKDNKNFSFNGPYKNPHVVIGTFHHFKKTCMNNNVFMHD